MEKIALPEMIDGFKLTRTCFTCVDISTKWASNPCHRCSRGGYVDETFEPTDNWTPNLRLGLAIYGD